MQISARSRPSWSSSTGPARPPGAGSPASPTRGRAGSHRRRSVAGGFRRARRPGGRCRSSGRRRSPRAAAAGGRSCGRAVAPPPPPPGAAQRSPSAPASPWLPAACHGLPSLVSRRSYGKREGPAAGGKACGAGRCGAEAAGRGTSPRGRLGCRVERGGELGQRRGWGRCEQRSELRRVCLSRFRIRSRTRSAGRNNAERTEV